MEHERVEKAVKKRETTGTRNGFLLPLLCIVLTSLLFLSSLVLYQAFYAYTAAYAQYQACRAAYACDGLLYNALDDTINEIRLHGDFTQPRTVRSPEWPTSTVCAEVTIVPNKKSYTLTATLDAWHKTATLMRVNHEWHVSIDQ
jgi:hypothetical protein